MKILRNSLLILILAAVTWMFFDLYRNFHTRDGLNPLAEYYATTGPEQVGAANLVTSVVVTYRGFDTLGEVTILFLTAAIIGLLLKTEKKKYSESLRESSEFLITASKVLIPIITLTGVYIFINGHLTPGGGFQGGAVLASTFILLLVSVSNKKVGYMLLDITEAVSGFAFVIIGILGIFLAGGFLDNAILPLGKFGTLLSAGTIPLIYTFIGFKVGAELSNIILELKQTGNPDAMEHE